MAAVHDQGPGAVTSGVAGAGLPSAPPSTEGVERGRRFSQVTSSSTMPTRPMTVALHAGAVEHRTLGEAFSMPSAPSYEHLTHDGTVSPGVIRDREATPHTPRHVATALDANDVMGRTLMLDGAPSAPPDDSGPPVGVANGGVHVEGYANGHGPLLAPSAPPASAVGVDDVPPPPWTPPPSPGGAAATVDELDFSDISALMAALTPSADAPAASVPPAMSGMPPAVNPAAEGQPPTVAHDPGRPAGTVDAAGGAHASSVPAAASVGGAVTSAYHALAGIAGRLSGARVDIVTTFDEFSDRMGSGGDIREGSLSTRYGDLTFAYKPDGTVALRAGSPHVLRHLPHFVSALASHLGVPPGSLKLILVSNEVFDQFILSVRMQQRARTSTGVEDAPVQTQQNAQRPQVARDAPVAQEREEVREPPPPVPASVLRMSQSERDRLADEQAYAKEQALKKELYLQEKKQDAIKLQNRQDDDRRDDALSNR